MTDELEPTRLYIVMKRDRVHLDCKTCRDWKWYRECKHDTLLETWHVVSTNTKPGVCKGNVTSINNRLGEGSAKVMFVDVVDFLDLDADLATQCVTAEKIMLAAGARMDALNARLKKGETADPIKKRVRKAKILTRMPHSCQGIGCLCKT